MTYENLPSTNTPLNATNLNAMQGLILFQSEQGVGNTNIELNDTINNYSEIEIQFSRDTAKCSTGRVTVTKNETNYIPLMNFGSTYLFLSSLSINSLDLTWNYTYAIPHGSSTHSDSDVVKITKIIGYK